MSSETNLRNNSPLLFIEAGGNTMDLAFRSVDRGARLSGAVLSSRAENWVKN